MSTAVTLCSPDLFTSLSELFGQYRLRVNRVASGDDIPGSYWGDSEAGLVGDTLFARDDTPVHSVLHEGCHFVDLVSQMLGVQVGSTGPVMVGPLEAEIDRDLAEVVGHDAARRDVHDRRHRDAPLVSWVRREVGLLEPLDPEDRIDAARIEIISYGKERPVATGEGEEVRAKNRRVRTLIVDE